MDASRRSQPHVCMLCLLTNNVFNSSSLSQQLIRLIMHSRVEPGWRLDQNTETGSRLNTGRTVLVWVGSSGWYRRVDGDQDPPHPPPSQGATHRLTTNWWGTSLGGGGGRLALKELLGCGSEAWRPPPSLGTNGNLNGAFTSSRWYKRCFKRFAHICFHNKERQILKAQMCLNESRWEE